MSPSSRQTELIVALDFPRAEQAMSLVDRLEGLPLVYKVGLELFMSEGPSFVKELVHRRSRVFLDLKFHDIPNTVARAARQAALLHVEMITLHLAGGRAMFRSVIEELSEIPHLKPKLLGVSVLTSFDDVRWAEVTRALTSHAIDTSISVEGLVSQAPSWGADGVVCSALELPEIRRQFPGMYVVVPGIRPSGTEVHDQSRVVTPAAARAMGANAIVVGRPISESRDPRKMVETILKDLSHKLREDL